MLLNVIGTMYLIADFCCLLSVILYGIFARIKRQRKAKCMTYITLVFLAIVVVLAVLIVLKGVGIL